MTEETKAAGGAPAGVSDSTQLLWLEKRRLNEEAESREFHKELHKQHNRRYLIIASLEVAGVWAIAITLFFKT
jgi:hypothetical protein